MAKLFNRYNYKWSIEGLEKCIKENNLKSKILLSNKYGAIVHVTSYEDSVVLGNESCWCISEHECSWEQYVKKTKGIQLFFYMFNEPIDSNFSLFGATFQVENDKVKTYCCFTRKNCPISKEMGYNSDEEALIHAVVLTAFCSAKKFFHIVKQVHNETYGIDKPKEYYVDNTTHEVKTTEDHIDYLRHLYDCFLMVNKK